MFSGEEMVKRLETILYELHHSPDLIEMEELDLVNFAVFAGGADACLRTTYRMVRRLIKDIQGEMDKDLKQAEENRILLEEYTARKAAENKEESADAE